MRSFVPKPRFFSLALVAAALVLISCSYEHRKGGGPAGGRSPHGVHGHGPGATPGGDRVLTYTELSARVFAPKCARCHNTNRPTDGVAMDTFANVMKLVDPGKPTQSALWNVIESRKMPLGSVLDDASIELVRVWIEQGAKEK